MTTWNPADLNRVTLSNGNLTLSSSGTSQGGVRSTTNRSSGKWHFEGTINTNAASDTGIGIATGSANFTSLAGSATGGVIAFTDFSSGAIWLNGGASGSALGNAVNGDVIAVEVDIGAKLFWAAKNAGNWNGSGTANPATGAGGISFSALTGPFFVAGTESVGTVVTANFGGTAMSRTVSSGFSVWDAATGPDPAGLLLVARTIIDLGRQAWRYRRRRRLLRPAPAFA